MRIIAGPCVIESRDHCMQMAKEIKKIAEKHNADITFKASFDKANRTSIESYRGPGLKEGLRILQEVKKQTGLPIVTDVHETQQIEPTSKVADIIQIPALLCRQTDLLVEAGKYGKIINIKKGQFMDPYAMEHAVKKAQTGGAKNIYITERGTSFGYNNLVVDFRSLIIMRSFAQTILDITHSVQLPSGAGLSSDGQKQFAMPLMKAGLAVGIDGVFMEVHNNPKEALSDGPNMLTLNEFEEAISYIMAQEG
jgi:2-dehydro-3-deoxyphosphooctonate aldolase (KDO 8-P synthase)